MHNNFFIFLSLSTALFTTINTSFAMDTERDTRKIRKTEHTQEDLISILKTANQHFSTACKLNNYQSKAEAFDKIVNILESNLTAFLNLGIAEFTETYTQFLALSLRHQGEALYNAITTSASDKTTQTQVEKLCQSQQCMRRSYNFYSILNPTPENQKEALESRTHLAVITHTLGLTYSSCADKEKEDEKSIDFHLKALKELEESFKFQETPIKKKEFQLGLKLALKKGLDIYSIMVSNTKIFQETNTIKKYQSLILNSNTLYSTINLFNNHLLAATVPFQWFIETDNKQKQTQQHHRQKKKTSDTTPTVLHPKDYMVLLWSTYCGILKGASHTALNLNLSNEMLTTLYQKKGSEHLDVAFRTYKENIYQGEYQNAPLKEHAFILARLESLAENEEPLKDFYRNLRQEHKEQQKQALIKKIQTQQEEKHRQEAAEQKAAEAKESQMKARQERATSRQQSSDIGPSSEAFYETSNSSHLKSVEKVEKKNRVKTRGVAQSIPVLETATSTTETGRNCEKTPRIIILRSQIQQHTFQSLIGETHNRNITLQDVKSLLVALGCKITDAKGSHQKATAPNNAIWTIPPAWDGPIPHYYRQQLMHFLENDMEISEGLLQVKTEK